MYTEKQEYSRREFRLMHERDTALSRAEAAEEALMGRDLAIVALIAILGAVVLALILSLAHQVAHR